MNEKARQRLIDGINRMAGRADCSEAVVLQQRNPAITAVLIAAALLIGIAMQSVADVGGVVLGGLIGLIIGGGMVLTTSAYWLGRCGDDVVLVTTNTLQSKPQQLVAVLSSPVEAEIRGGVLAKKVTVADESYLVALAQIKRFRTVVGLPD